MTGGRLREGRSAAGGQLRSITTLNRPPGTRLRSNSLRRRFEEARNRRLPQSGCTELGVDRRIRLMTLRQYLGRPGLHDRYWLVLPGALIWVGALLFLLRSSPGIAAMICVLSVPLMYIYTPQLFRLVRCPRCHKRLGELAYVAVMGSGPQLRWGPSIEKAARRAERLGKCQHCGLRLDEDVEGSA